MIRALRIRPTRRSLFRFAVLATAAIALGMWMVSFGTGQTASAQLSNGFDPASSAVSFIQSNDWLGHAQTWARQIYLGLFIFEIIALGITALLFRDNLGEFFASVALKLVMGSVFFWFITVAGPGLGQLPGQVVTGTFGNTFGKGFGGTDDISGIVSEGALAAGAYFGASYGMRLADGARATLTEATTPVADVNPLNCTQVYVGPFATGGGTCHTQPAKTVAFGRQAAENVTSGLGLMTGMAVAAIFLQFTLLTIETYFVMTVGVLFVGFAATRFTSSFSQGYFSYMISVGVKLMTFYIILGLVGPMMLSVLESAVGSLAGAILDPSGFAALGAALFGVMSCVVAAGLVYAVPGLAASFLTGSSSVSGAAVASQAMRSIAGGSQMMAQMASSAMHRNREVSVEKAEYAKQHAGAGHAGAQAHNMSPASKNRDEPMSNGAKPREYAGGVKGEFQKAESVLGDTLGLSRPSTHRSDGAETSDQHRELPRKTERAAQTASAAGAHAAHDSEAARHNGAPGDSTDKAVRDPEGKDNHGQPEADRVKSDQSMGFALGAIASAAPQESAPPSAVQVRVGTPDRL